MKIYFAGSIRGGRDDQKLYGEIIHILKGYGEVLTEHLGDVTLSQMGETASEESIYKRDIAWLNDADVVVAEVTTPSLGVGYELGRAESLKKKIICLYRQMPDRSLSAMVRGNNAFYVYEYKNLGDLQGIFDTFLK